jgi:hypothetical protein
MNAKLDTARVFERTFKIYGDQFTLLIPAALVLFIPVALLNALILASGSVLAALLATAVALVAIFWLQGMVVEAARDILDGRRDHTIGSLIESATPFIAPLLGAGVLVAIGVTIGFILLIVPGLILLTIWAVIVPVIVLERAGVMDSFGRSRDIVRGNGWRVFGVIVVLLLLQLVASAVVNSIVGEATDDSYVGYVLADLVVRVLVAPLWALAATVVYLELTGPRPGEAGTVAPLPPQETPPPAPERPTT